MKAPRRSKPRLIELRELGRLAYPAALEVQLEAHAAVVAGARPRLLALEHEPVYTLGRREMPNQFIPGKDRADIPVVKTGRGGEITYHGPGQAVVYVILPLEPFRLTLPTLVDVIEQAIIDVAADSGVAAERRPGWRGVYVGARKLASIGLAVRHDVTLHGLAINVENDLAPFERINPCGLPVEMCSLASLGARHAGRVEVGRQVGGRLAEALGCRLT